MPLGSAATTTRPFSASITSYPSVCGIVFRGSVPFTSPWTNSRPLIVFCSSALTVPYVLRAIGLGIGFHSWRVDSPPSIIAQDRPVWRFSDIIIRQQTPPPHTTCHRKHAATTQNPTPSTHLFEIKTTALRDRCHGDQGD